MSVIASKPLCVVTVNLFLFRCPGKSVLRDCGLFQATVFYLYFHHSNFYMTGCNLQSVIHVFLCFFFFFLRTILQCIVRKEFDAIVRLGISFLGNQRFEVQNQYIINQQNVYIRFGLFQFSLHHTFEMSPSVRWYL